MNREKLEQLHQKIAQMPTGGGAEETALRTALQEYMSRTEKFYQVDKNGFLPPITQEAKDALIEQYDKLIEALDRFIQKEETYDPRLVEAVNEFAELASWRFHILWRYDPQKGLKSAQTLAEEHRTPTLRVKNALHTVAGGNRKREVVAYLDDSGHERRGVFTEKQREERPTANVKLALKELATSIQDMDAKGFIEHLLDLSKDQLNGLFQKEHSQLTVKDFSGRDSAAVYYLLRYACPKGEEMEKWIPVDDYGDGYSEVTYAPRTLDSVAEGLAKLSGGRYTAEDIIKHVGANELTRFAALLDKQKLPPCRSYEIPEGTRTEANGIGVSVLADWFGVPDVVACTTNAILVKNGKPVEGSLMCEAKGLTIDGAPEELFEEIDMDCLNDLEESHGSAKKAAVEMGWLDCICVNEDRSTRNMAYEFGKHNKLVHFEGFDHDGTFPAHMPEEDGQNISDATFERMRFISASMARQIEKMDEKNLKRLRFALWCSGISQAQRDVTVNLIKKAKDFILESRKHYSDFDKGRTTEELEKEPYRLAPPFVREIPDDDFHRVRFYEKDYQPAGIYHTLKGVLAPFRLQSVKKQGLDLQKEQQKYRLPVKDIIGADSRATAPGLSLSQKKLEEWYAQFTNRELAHVVEEHHEGSAPAGTPEQTLERAVERLYSYQNELLRRLNSSGLEQSITPKELEKIVALNKNLEACAWNVLDHKLGTKGESVQWKMERYHIHRKGERKDFDGGNGHIDAVLAVLDLAKKGQEWNARECETVVFNTRQAEERRHYQQIKG